MNPTIRLALALTACTAVGAAVASVYLINDAPEAAVSETGFNASASTEQRILALEQALSNEREARQMLETELFSLIDEVEAMSAADPVGESVAADRRPDAASAVDRATRMSDFQRQRNDPEARADYLVERGFSEDRAAFIAGRESELRFEVMQAQWQARRDGEEVDWRNSMVNADLALRNELGQLEYEQYLEANNRPTAIGVNGVLQSSPAEGAGLRTGDRITHYNGERVYNMMDINRLVGGYAETSNIVIDIERDGVPMQVSLPPGPLGITGGNWRRRR
ncbi:MAG: PDZ domain-containing protein [Pseudomonadota bacterium]